MVTYACAARVGAKKVVSTEPEQSARRNLSGGLTIFTAPQKTCALIKGVVR